MKTKHLDDMIDVIKTSARAISSRDGAETAYSRRSFLKGGLVAASMAAMPFEFLGTRNAAAAELPYSPDYGPLSPVTDETTGLTLLSLPDGFRYKSTAGPGTSWRTA